MLKINFKSPPHSSASDRSRAKSGWQVLGALAAVMQAAIFLVPLAGAVFIGPSTLGQLPLFLAAVVVLLSPAPLGLLGLLRPRLAGLCMLSLSAVCVLLFLGLVVYGMYFRSPRLMVDHRSLARFALFVAPEFVAGLSFLRGAHLTRNRESRSSVE